MIVWFADICCCYWMDEIYLKKDNFSWYLNISGVQEEKFIFFLGMDV